MNIVQPSSKIILPETLNDSLRRIEYAARISHRSEFSMSLNEEDGTTEKFIRAVVISHGDWSVTEHVSASVEFLIDRGVSHELVRHRLFSFTQESTRFVNYTKRIGLNFISPFDAGTEEYITWDFSMCESESMYNKLIADGVRPQEARSVLPNSLASKIIMTGNLRNWRHFLLMRTTKESHPQMRQVTIPLLAEFQKAVPILFDDIEPNMRQVDNIKKGR